MPQLVNRRHRLLVDTVPQPWVMLLDLQAPQSTRECLFRHGLLSLEVEVEVVMDMVAITTAAEIAI